MILPTKRKECTSQLKRRCRPILHALEGNEIESPVRLGLLNDNLRHEIPLPTNVQRKCLSFQEKHALAPSARWLEMNSCSLHFVQLCFVCLQNLYVTYNSQHSFKGKKTLIHSLIRKILNSNGGATFVFLQYACCFVRYGTRKIALFEMLLADSIILHECNEM